jgi:hypothetical protein
MAGLFGRKQEQQAEGLIWHDAGSDVRGSSEGSLSDGMGDADCAWCLAEQGIVSQSGSHGICAYHAQQVYQSYRGRRGHRG